MSRQKERKLKKIRSQKILPKFFGILLTVIFFSIISVFIICFFLVNVIFNKVQKGHDDSNKVVQILEEEFEDGNIESWNEVSGDIIKYMTSIHEVCVVDKDNNITYKSGEDEPKFEYYIKGLSEGKNKFYATEDKKGLIHVKNGKINYDEAIDLIFELLYLINDDLSDGFLETEEFTSICFWYQIPMENEDYSICVKNHIPIKKVELWFVTLLLDVLLLVAVVMIFYYISAIVGLVFERRKHIIMMTTDTVTGGYNFQYFVEKGNKTIKKWRKHKKSSGKKYSVVVIRMEKYRNFCSCYGVKEGEELLEGLGEALKLDLCRKEIVAHSENADFSLLMSYSSVDELLQRINKMLIRMNTIKEKQKKYFSIGIYVAENSDDSIEIMYNYAVVAVNTINEDSNKRVAWFNEEMKQDQLWMRKVENDMDNALRNKEFKVFLQPKYSTKDEVLSGAEALVRWQHPTEGFVPPFKFIPIFETNGFVMQLDDYMLSEVARQQAKWIKEGKNTVPISVNISRVHFIQEDLAEHICRIVDEYNVPHNLIELELTESAFFDDKGVLLKTIQKLKEFGFLISMDDFGSGYSSLNSLKELPLDVVKLDAGFFRDSDETGRGKLIVGDTISLAKKLDMKIVAEGIETREQVDFLANMNCDLIQGYYFAKPMPIDEFETKAFA